MPTDRVFGRYPDLDCSPPVLRNMFKKTNVRQYVLWAIIVDAPFVYSSAVTLDDPVLTVASLTVMGIASVLAVWAY